MVLATNSARLISVAIVASELRGLSKSEGDELRPRGAGFLGTAGPALPPARVEVVEAMVLVFFFW